MLLIDYESFWHIEMNNGQNYSTHHEQMDHGYTGIKHRYISVANKASKQAI